MAIILNNANNVNSHNKNNNTNIVLMYLILLSENYLNKIEGEYNVNNKVLKRKGMHDVKEMESVN